MRILVIILFVSVVCVGCSPHAQWPVSDVIGSKPPVDWLTDFYQYEDSVYFEKGKLWIRGRKGEIHRTIQLDSSGAYFVDHYWGGARGNVLFEGWRHYDLSGNIMWRWSGYQRPQKDVRWDWSEAPPVKPWKRKGHIYGEKEYAPGEVLYKKTSGRYQKEKTVVYSNDGKRATVAMNKFRLQR